MIYITGDIHREQDIHKINPREFTVGDTLTENDYVIICGDFGCVWDGSTGDNFWLKWLDSLPWNTLFIDGNHENFDVLNTYPIEEYKGGKVHRIRSKVFHLMRGEVFDIDGYKFFTMGGGFSHDVCYRTEHKNWWKDEICTIEEAKHAFDTLAYDPTHFAQLCEIQESLAVIWNDKLVRVNKSNTLTAVCKQNLRFNLILEVDENIAGY